ncbi:hypothetical protein [Phocoenobacter skyensis]|uniref:Uncharacterized protein n=1 Tax=Phocoenobacter skyensis TaxID=97481 RepID=A0A1H7XFC3_9PAST|nr:hypothetical protein [Pasteurella skyensis]MDP8079696.1 hypothetical protein [Pasteurella skyensis]MDP8085604.1 hypothetical protein [Pasteurella skyensis]MDP8185414.1 hypothetical protein [Pasteurella skyensis]QLB22178.1 hypothetical protein A6B44_02775 [Pasteurella skyensis]SEM32506.1 hypothetical protein SAMN05444853_11259 [Pasteurella skyensis]
MTNSVTKPKRQTQFLKVLRLLILENFTGIDKNLLWIISPRNYIYKLEKEHLPQGVKIKRTKTANEETGNHYFIYSIPDLDTMKRVIALYKAKGGELTEAEEQYALSRFDNEEEAKNELFN